MKQIRVFTQRITAGDVIGRSILEARASQVLLLHGFRMELHMPLQSDFASDGDSIDLHALLMAYPRAPLVGQGGDTEALDAFVKRVGTLGWVHQRMAIRAPATEGVIISTGVPNPGWTPCEFEVPGLWMAGWNLANNNSGIGTVSITINFDWVSRTPIQVAALYTTWGFDAVDMTEREDPTGEIDFTKAVGDGVLPNSVG